MSLLCLKGPFGNIKAQVQDVLCFPSQEFNPKRKLCLCPQLLPEAPLEGGGKFSLLEGSPLPSRAPRVPSGPGQSREAGEGEGGGKTSGRERPAAAPRNPV